MPRITVTITDEQAELLEEKTGDDGEYESKSEAMRSFISEYEHLSERVDELETENERLHRERRQLLEQREEHTDLVRAAYDEFLELGLPLHVVRQGDDDPDVIVEPESEEREEYQFTKGDLRNFDPGEAVICRQGKGWVHGRIKMLEE